MNFNLLESLFFLRDQKVQQSREKRIFLEQDGLHTPQAPYQPEQVYVYILYHILLNIIWNALYMIHVIHYIQSSCSYKYILHKKTILLSISDIIYRSNLSRYTYANRKHKINYPYSTLFNLIYYTYNNVIEFQSSRNSAFLMWDHH